MKTGNECGGGKGWLRGESCLRVFVAMAAATALLESHAQVPCGEMLFQFMPTVRHEAARLAGAVPALAFGGLGFKSLATKSVGLILN